MGIFWRVDSGSGSGLDVELGAGSFFVGVSESVMKRIIVLFSLIAASGCFAGDIDVDTLTNLSYRDDVAKSGDNYMSSQCVLDLYRPKGRDGFATIVWFHGGGLTSGKNTIPEGLMESGVAVVAPAYRLSPKVKASDCIDDAAAAVAWVFNNIESYGGDPDQIFVSGHSAGGYLTSMVGLDQSWLDAYGIDANDIAGLIPFSGHTITHFTVRKEQGIAKTQPIIDKMAPLFHVRADASPLLLITGDRELEMLGRYEENAYFMRMMKVAGHQDTRLIELGGYGHGIADAAFPLLLKEVQRLSGSKAASP